MTAVNLHIAPDQDRKGFDLTHYQNKYGEIEKPYNFISKINTKFFSMINFILNFKDYFATI